MKICKLYLLLAVSVLLASCATGENDVEDVRLDQEESQPQTRLPDSTGATAKASENVILFLGNSLTAGLGVDENDAFPSLIQQKIDSLGWDYAVVNAGISGETTSGGLGRIDWVLEQPIDILILELGGNDGLRGIPTDVTRRNLEEIIIRTQEVYPDAEILLAGMQIPPNLGHQYTQDFRAIYPDLAEEYDVHLIPFLLEDVGGVASMMQNDGIHPNVQGHRVVAENVWDVLKPILEESLSPAA